MTVRALSDLLSRFSNARHGNQGQDYRDLAESVYPISAKANRSATAQSIDNNTLTVVQLDTELWDDGGIFDLGTNNTRATIQTSDKYLINVGSRWATNSSGVRALQVFKNGTTVVAAINLPQSGDSANQNGDAAISLVDAAVAGDFYSIRVFQNSGGPLDLSADARNALSVVRVGATP